MILQEEESPCITILHPTSRPGGHMGLPSPVWGEDGRGCSHRPPGIPGRCHPKEHRAAFGEREVVGATRELCTHPFSTPAIQLPGCRRHSLAMASAGTASASPPPLQGPGRASAAAAEQGDCCPRSSRSSDHLFANKTSILEASLTLGHSPS